MSDCGVKSFVNDPLGKTNIVVISINDKNISFVIDLFTEHSFAIFGGVFLLFWSLRFHFLLYSL